MLIKPENILIELSKNQYIRNHKKINKVILCDFSSVLKLNEPIKHYNHVSCWYRAPEIYYKFSNLNYIDLWSFGCVLYELWYKSPLFKCNYANNKPENYNLQFVHLNKLGYPSSKYYEKNKVKEDLIINIDASKTVELNIKRLLLSIPYNNIIQKLLIWEPINRITAQQIIDTYFSNK